jgi:hypothetical protein
MENEWNDDKEWKDEKNGECGFADEGDSLLLVHSQLSQCVDSIRLVATRNTKIQFSSLVVARLTNMFVTILNSKYRKYRTLR